MLLNGQDHDVVPVTLQLGPVPEAAVTLAIPLPSLAVPDKVVVLPEMVLLLPVKATFGATLSRVTVKPPVALQTGVLTPSAARALKVLLPGDKDTLAKL
jgi:hypothetical protein